MVSWSAYPLGNAVCRGHAQDHVLLLEPQKWKLGFDLFVSCCSFAPNVQAMQLVLACYS